MTPTTMTTPRRRRPWTSVLAAALVLGAIQLAAEGSASAQSEVVTSYDGTDCVSVSNADRLAMTYSSVSGAVAAGNLRCPILRTQQTYTTVYAEVVFGDVSTPTFVQCNIISGSENTNLGAGQEYPDTISGSGWTLYPSLTMTDNGGSAPFWTAMGNDANAHWQTESLNCELPAGVPILGYTITEYP